MNTIKEALELNQAVYELYLETTGGDVSAVDLAVMTNRAMDLNKEALAALEKDGYVLVPVEPTMKQVVHGANARQECAEGDKAEISAIYKAMIKAAQEG